MKNNQKNKGSKNNLINNQIQGNNNNIFNNTVPQIEPRRTKQKPFTIFNKHVKTKWFPIIGIIAIIADLITLYTNIKPFFSGKLFDSGIPENGFSFFYLFFILFMIALFAFSLHDTFKNSVLSIGKYKIASHQGKLYFEEYEASCPHCGGKMTLVSSFNKSHLQCKLYPEHNFLFNPKIFDKEYY